MKFIWGLVAGLFLGIAMFAGLVSLAVGIPTVETQGIAAMARRKAEIARGIDRPKLLFVGGSSVDLGISAQRASEMLGMPAVNMGLIAPLGGAYMTDKIREMVAAGDVVVLALEYNLYGYGRGDAELWLDPSFVRYVIAQDPDYLNGLPWWYRGNVVARISDSHLATALLRRRNNKRGASDVTDTWGDRTDNELEKRPEVAAARQKPLDQLRDGLGNGLKGFPVIAEFVAWAKRNDIKVIATFPNIARNAAYDDAVLGRVEKQLVDFYSSLGVPVVGSLRGAMFPQEDCFDTPFHLIKPAVERRTIDLCRALAPHLSGMKEPATSGSN